jgi:sulfoxide reductase heme-binding subunit YedZ
MSAATGSADWYLMRGSGVVSLLLLTLVLALGIATANRARPRGLPLYVTTTVHRNAALLAVSFLSLHVLTALVDPDAAVSIANVLVPFTGGRSSGWLGLGALALELVALLVVTSLLRRRMDYRVWRAVHWLAYLAWPLAFFHGIGLGTDAGTPWMRLVDAGCALAVGGALAWRMLGLEPPKPKPRTGQPLPEASRRGGTAR